MINKKIMGMFLLAFACHLVAMEREKQKITIASVHNKMIARRICLTTDWCGGLTLEPGKKHDWNQQIPTTHSIRIATETGFFIIRILSPEVRRKKSIPEMLLYSDFFDPNIKRNSTGKRISGDNFKIIIDEKGIVDAEADEMHEVIEAFDITSISSPAQVLFNPKDQQQVRQYYKMLCAIWHPDRNSEMPKYAHAVFNVINEAYKAIEKADDFTTDNLSKAYPASGAKIKQNIEAVRKKIEELSKEQPH